MIAMKKYQDSADFILSKIKKNPEFAMILGTGLNSISDILEDKVVIPYSDIPGFSISTAPSHSGKLIFGKVNQSNILIMQGRLHYYEGYSMEEITFPIRVFKLLGIKSILITNAAGSLNKNLIPGSLVLLEDHINFMGTNPLIGQNMVEFGERFPSMNNSYDTVLRNKIKDIAFKNQINLFDGIYAAVSGPSLETKAECYMIKGFGADLVGMSTVPEVIIAVHCGIKVAAISVVTNLSNIFHDLPHSQEEIRENADKAKLNIIKIIKELLVNLNDSENRRNCEE